MEYFYDHETDVLSVTIAAFDGYESSEEVAPGVLVHTDGKRRALAIEIRAAKTAVGVRGLQSFEPKKISGAELSEMMGNSANGRAVLRALKCA